MCVDVLERNVVTPPQARLVQPRSEWRSIVAERWQHYRQVWCTVTASPPLSTLDESIESLAPGVSGPKPQSLTRSVLT
jgi:xylulokinase